MSLVNTDIYNITESINELTKRYIDSEDEETLALSIYGYITSLDSKKIQTAIMMIGELSNEFISRLNNVIIGLVIEDIDIVVDFILYVGIQTGTVKREQLYEDVEYLYNKMYNSQSPAHSVAYSGMLQLFATDGYELTSRQVQAGFKKLGLDFKEILKPTTDWVTEKRIEEKEESKEIKTEDMVVNPKIKNQTIPDLDKTMI